MRLDDASARGFIADFLRWAGGRAWTAAALIAAGALLEGAGVLLLAAHQIRPITASTAIAGMSHLAAEFVPAFTA